MVSLFASFWKGLGGFWGWCVHDKCIESNIIGWGKFPRIYVLSAGKVAKVVLCMISAQCAVGWVISEMR